MIHPFTIPPELRNELRWLVRQYDRIKSECNDLIVSSPDPSRPRAHTNMVTSPVETAMIRTESLSNIINAIDSAIAVLPDYYRKPVFEHTAYGKGWPDFADRNTFKRYQRIFMYYLAVKLGRI